MRKPRKHGSNKQRANGRKKPRSGSVLLEKVEIRWQ
jgi:hypothetical protein